MIYDTIYPTIIMLYSTTYKYKVSRDILIIIYE